MSHITVIGMAEDKSEVIDALMGLGLVELDTVEPDESEQEIESALEDQPDQPIVHDWFADISEEYKYQDSDEEQTHIAALDAMSRLEMAIEFCRNLRDEKSKNLDSATDAEMIAAGSRENDIMDRLQKLESCRSRADEVSTRSA